jgi:hypothetical protein
VVFKKINNFINNFTESIRFNEKERVIYDALKARKVKSQSSGIEKVVLIENVDNIYYLGLFGEIVIALKGKANIHAHQFVMQSLIPKQFNSLLIFFASYFNQYALKRKLKALYGAYCDGVGYESNGFSNPAQDVFDVIRSYKYWKKIKSKEDVINLEINQVPIGDLVADSFLRFKPAIAIDVSDAYLWFVIWQACRDLRRAKAYFSTVKPDIYLTTYSTYIQHGIAVRVALQERVSVYALGNSQEFAKKLTLQDRMHLKHHSSYKKEFSQLANQSSCMEMADTELASRMNGFIDNATFYMKKSAYQDSTIQVPDVENSVGLFLHNFFDAPHPFTYSVFPDFWDWISNSIKVFEENGIPFFIKPHPNQLDLSDGALNELSEHYPNAMIISSDISNKQLIQAGMTCCVTVFGTIAHEMAYLGVPTICAGDNPHTSFNFCQTAKNRYEYEVMLKNHHEFVMDKSEMKNEAKAFYYMHNLHLEEGLTNLNKLVIHCMRLCADENASASKIPHTLKDIRFNAHFTSFINQLIED